MKFSKKDLVEMIKKNLHESSKEEESFDDKSSKYAEKCEKLLDETLEKLNELAEEGQKITQSNLLRRQNSNQMLMNYVGTVKKLVGLLLGAKQKLKTGV